MLKKNLGKKTEIQINGQVYERLTIKTKLITPKDNILKIVLKYARPYLKKGDILFISEKVVAITQGRSYPLDKIKPSKMAKFLAKYVTKTSYGIGISIPETMELAIREIGKPRIILAAFIAALTKPLGIKGMFYRVAGSGARAVDGPTSYTIPPYNNHATLGPKDPDKVAKRIAANSGYKTVIIDANDLGVNILGTSEKMNQGLLQRIFSDNPMGQADEQTPLCILRKKF